MGVVYRTVSLGATEPPSGGFIFLGGFLMLSSRLTSVYTKLIKGYLSLRGRSVTHSWEDIDGIPASLKKHSHLGKIRFHFHDVNIQHTLSHIHRYRHPCVYKGTHIIHMHVCMCFH